MAEAGLLGGFTTGIGLGASYNTIMSLVRLGFDWAKWKATGRQLGYPKIASVLQTLISAEKDEVHGLSSKGVVDTIFEFIDSTMDFALWTSEALASQLFIQMIQQSVAYAITNSVAGSVGTISNVYSGSSGLPTIHSNVVGQNFDLADTDVKSFLLASMGLNIPSVAFEVTRGANQRLEDILTRIVTQADSLVDSWNDYVTNFYTHYHTMARNRFQDALEMYESLLTRAYSLLEQVANDHLSRINEQLDTLEGARSWYESGFISVDDLKDIAIRVNLERQASENSFDEYVTEILNSVETAKSDWDSKINQALDDLKTCISKYASFVSSVLGTLFNDVLSFVNAVCSEANTVIENVCAYRNVTKPVDVEVSDRLGS
jgi:transcription termination factor NusB